MFQIQHKITLLSKRRCSIASLPAAGEIRLITPFNCRNWSDGDNGSAAAQRAMNFTFPSHLPVKLETLGHKKSEYATIIPLFVTKF